VCNTAIYQLLCVSDTSWFRPAVVVVTEEPGIIKLFPSRESLVSDIPAGDRKTANLFFQCIPLLSAVEVLVRWGIGGSRTVLFSSSPVTGSTGKIIKMSFCWLNFSEIKNTCFLTPVSVIENVWSDWHHFSRLKQSRAQNMIFNWLTQLVWFACESKITTNDGKIN